MVPYAGGPQPRPADPATWRPQEARPARRPHEITDPIIEPLWTGRRALAHFRVARAADGSDSGEVRLIDRDGSDVTEDEPTVADALRNGVMAFEAVIDGILTGQATTGGVGRSFAPVVEARKMSLIAPRRYPEEPKPDPRTLGPFGETAFVCLDLLFVDGQQLFDVPLLERRRQLESLVVESEVLRVTPYVRPPLHIWFNTWRSAGFAGVMLKASNSRYRPGEFTSEWTKIQRLPGS